MGSAVNMTTFLMMERAFATTNVVVGELCIANLGAAASARGKIRCLKAVAEYYSRAVAARATDGYFAGIWEQEHITIKLTGDQYSARYVPISFILHPSPFSFHFFHSFQLFNFHLSSLFCYPPSN